MGNGKQTLRCFPKIPTPWSSCFRVLFSHSIWSDLLELQGKCRNPNMGLPGLDQKRHHTACAPSRVTGSEESERPWCEEPRAVCGGVHRARILSTASTDSAATWDKHLWSTSSSPRLQTWLNPDYYFMRHHESRARIIQLSCSQVHGPQKWQGNTDGCLTMPSFGICFLCGDIRLTQAQRRKRSC